MQNGEEFMLNCSDVKKTYFNKTAVENISLSLENGKIYALKELADRTRMYYTYGPSIDYQGGRQWGKYGVAEQRHIFFA